MNFAKFRNAASALVLAIATVVPVGTLAKGVSGDYLAARQASFLGDFAAASKHYGRAIMFDPDNPVLLERATLAELSLGDIERASILADRLAATGQSSQVGQMVHIAKLASEENYSAVLEEIEAGRGASPLVDGLVEAWSELGRGDMSAAAAKFDELSKQQGLGSFAVYHKALALALVGDFESAVALFEQTSAGGLQLTRRGVMAHAEMLSQLGRNADALALLDRSFGASLDPGLQQLHDALAEGKAVPFSLIRTPRDGLAEVFYTLATALSKEANDDFTLLYSRVAEYLRPDHVDALLLSADLLEKLGQYDLAVKTYGRVPEDHPSFHAAELGRAGALRTSGKVDAAIEVLQRLSKTHGNLPIVPSTLGDTLRRLERYEEAAAAYTKALELYSQEDRAQWFLHYARGICFERLGNWEKSEADFRAALKLNPDQPQVLNYLGYSLVEKHKNLDEALSLIERAVAARPDSGYIVDSLGWVLYRLGRYDEAVSHMERAAELMAVDPIVNDHLGDVYWAVGRKMEARFQWRRALSFATHATTAEDVDPDRIRRKLEVGLDQVLAEEGAPPLKVANGGD